MKPFLKLLLTSSLLALNFGINAHAQITTDGTTPTTCNGGGCSGSTGNVNIAGGVIAGANQFHSFSDFNISAGDTASFSGPASISNIISRVTGANPSNIQGSLVSNINGANFYFINPNGIVFGETASVDVSGGLHLGAVEQLVSENGTFFGENSGSTFFSSDPQGFGFNGHVGELSFVGSFEGYEGTVSLAGGNIIIGDSESSTDSVIDASQVNIISGTSGFYSLAEGLADSNFQGSGVVIQNASILNSPGSLGGVSSGIDIWGGDLSVTDSQISTFSNAVYAGDAINIAASNVTLQDGSVISTLTSSDNNAGDIALEVTEEISGDGTSLIESFTSSSGEAGDISLMSEVLVAGFNILNESIGTGGSPGNITLIARELTLLDENNISSGERPQLTDEEFFALVDSGQDPNDIFFFNPSAGEQGRTSEINLVISERALILGEVTSDAFNVQDGATINVTGGDLILDGGQIVASTGSFANAGDINISVDSLLVIGELDGFGARDGESIVTVSNVISEDRASGNAGTITIVSDNDIILEDRGEIRADSDSPFEEGFAGEISITVLNGNLILRRNAEINGTGFVVPGASITINVSGDVILQEASSIEVGSIPRGGDLEINLGPNGVLSLSGRSVINSSGGSNFDNLGDFGEDAGSAETDFSEFFDISDGTGGVISIGSTVSDGNFFIVLNNSAIQSQGDNPSARLEVSPAAFLLQDNSSLIAIDGTNSSPDPQVGGDNENLDENFENADQILASQCASQRGGQSSGLSILPNMGVATASDLKPSPLGGTVFYGGEELDESAIKEAHNKIDPFQDCI